MSNASTDLSEIINQLNKEPLTHLMAGHRELFHSNFLAWYFEHMPEQADEIFRSLSEEQFGSSNKRGVKREKKNIDLWLEWKDYKPLIIENKVFSLPDEKQLERYAEKIGQKHAVKFLLLSLLNPGWQGNRKHIDDFEWHWLGYGELSKRILATLPKEVVSVESYEIETVRRYARIVHNLSIVADSIQVKDENELVWPEELINVLNRSRLKDSFKKLRAASVMNWVRNSLAKAGYAELEMKADFTKGQPLIEGLKLYGLKDCPKAGWQLQGEQFRLAIIVPSDSQGRGDTGIARRISYARNFEWVFDFSILDESLDTSGKADGDQEKDFCHYAPDFIYRYRKVDFLTVIQLADAAKKVADHLSSRYLS